MLFAGCVETQLEPCGDIWCPTSKTCVADGLCASVDQIDACRGIADGEPCTFSGIDGYCDRGVCVPRNCGDEVVDPDEACDDGNTMGGDGCSADCQKVEVCGDGVVDVGEGCDDGNANPADGCDACTPTTWHATAVVGSAATAAGLGNPNGVAVDRLGNIYIADTFNRRVRRVDATGAITTIAGSGQYGSGGDNGPATNAQLATPVGVAVDGLGNVYIADAEAHRVRRVDGNGVITTLAGTGISGIGGDGAAATGAQLFYPYGVAVDGLGNVYIADSSNHRIRRVSPTGIITTFAGTTFGFGGDSGAATSAQLGLPRGVAVDGLGNIFIADTYNHRIRRVDVAGVITTVAGGNSAGPAGDGGLATNAQLNSPWSVAVDGGGNIFIADHLNHRIRRVDNATRIITRVAGTTSGFGGDGGAATSAKLDHPSGVAIDSAGNIFIADTWNNRIRRRDSTGVITSVAGTGTPGDGGAATSALLAAPFGIAVDALGNIFIADTYDHRIRRVDPIGVITTVAGTGAAGSGGDNGAATSAQLTNPFGVAVDAPGNVYIADTSNNRIRRVDTAGVITTVAGTGATGGAGDNGPAIIAELHAPFGVAVDAVGNIFIADSLNHRIRRVAATTGVITTVAGIGTPGGGGDNGVATSAELNLPNGVAIDTLGNIYIADTANHRIRRVDAVTRVITTVAGNGTLGDGGDGGPATSAQLKSPYGVAVDGAGNIFIADKDNQRIRRVDAVTRNIATVAGMPSSGFGGDGGAATDAPLNSPHGVAVDALGNFFIADKDNESIRRVDGMGIITTVAGVVDPDGMGPLVQAHLADPRALVVASGLTLIAGGSSGTVQAVRTMAAWLEVVAGRYAQLAATDPLARFRASSFGTVSGVAYDAAAGVIYLTETTRHRIHAITIVNPTNRNTWTIAPLANAAGTEGFADGAAGTARFREPTGLYLDPIARQLYVADTGNHVVRAIDLTSNTVRTIAGTPATRGFFGDGGAATAALLYAPAALTQCGNGDLFVADTGNHRVRRVAAGTSTISTVLGDGVAASSGEGRPASTYPVNAPLGLACDAYGNVFATSTNTVRLLPADEAHVVDGSGAVQTIYGAPPRDQFPASVTRCLTGIAVVDATTVQVTDSCTGLLVELRRTAQ